ncbi:Ubiquitin-60S ribosomal protein L40 [Orchesella cincta]|uniref:Ubiquitin-60S ribosomal protein L40 n=1 Tax=Orchesella cincta TaxID=48709 RepID=A0A1D2MUH2_ORCCI|nr:Ubiquitin-60S ribosomal protein L40 [Orchesella cincta]
MSKLVSNTQCNTLLVARLLEKGVLSANDTDVLKTLKNNEGEFRQSYELYTILKTRKDAYDILLESLNLTNQTGAAKILSDGISKERRITRVFWRDSGMSIPDQTEAKFNAILRGLNGELFSKVYLQDFSFLPKHWTLRYMNVLLADGTDLTTLLCDAKFPIYVNTNNGSTFIQIFVNTLLDKTFNFKVLDSVSVAYIKSLIFQEQDIPANQMRLIHNGQHLYDHKTLRECNILNNSVIFLVLRLRGGWLSTDFKAGQKDGVGLLARNEWEGYKVGLNLIGESSNKSCPTQEHNKGETIDRVGCGKSLFRFQIRNKIESIVLESFEGHDKYKYFDPAGNPVEYDKMEIHTVAEDWSLNFCIFCEAEEFKTLLKQEKPSQIITGQDEVIVRNPPDIVNTVDYDGISFRGKFLQFCLLIGFLAVVLAAGKNF